VTIGTQIWAAENLNCYVEGSKCYDDDPANCTKYGRLYDWVTATALPSGCKSSVCSSLIQTKHRGICPSEWHIPNDAEWTTLTNYVDSSTAGTKLKASSGWSSGNGTNEFDFSALPGGYGSSSGSFGSVGSIGYWWSATEYSASYAYGRYMYYDYAYVGRVDISKSGLYSVRCVKD
jgi:uncharacterized protein (TIGR02145 family)